MTTLWQADLDVKGREWALSRHCFIIFTTKVYSKYYFIHTTHAYYYLPGNTHFI